MLISRQRLLYLFGVFVVLLLLATAISEWTHIKNQLNDWKLLPQPERLTELYFTDSQHLPGTYTPGQTQVVAFTTHNLEYSITSYPYTVQEQSEDGKTTQTLAIGNFHLNQGAFKNTQNLVALVDMGQRAKVIVTLPIQHESIDYWIQRSGA